MYSSRPVGDVEAPAAVGEGRDAELGVPACVEHAWAHLEARSGSRDGGGAAGQRLRGGVGLLRAARRLRLQHLHGHLGAGLGGRLLDHPGQASELLVQILLGVEAPVDREPRRSGHDVEAGARAGLPADDQHRAGGLLALDRVARALVEQLAGEHRQRLGDADHVLERVDALVDVADVRLMPGRPDAQRDRATPGVPDHAAGRLGGEHGERGGVDQLGGAEVSGAGGAAGLLVADEMEDDPAIAEQAELTGGGGAVQHRHEPALHVGAATPGDAAVAALRLELRRGLRRHDVEVPVEVDEAGAAAGAPAHHRRALQRAGRLELDQLGRELEAVHGVPEQPGAAAELAAGRVLGRDAHELLEQTGHLLGTLAEPRLQLGARLDHGSESTAAANACALSEPRPVARS